MKQLVKHVSRLKNENIAFIAETIVQSAIFASCSIFEKLI